MNSIEQQLKVMGFGHLYTQVEYLHYTLLTYVTLSNFSNFIKLGFQCRDQNAYFTLCCVLSHFSRVQLFVTLWTTAREAPRSVGFSRQEYWSGLPFPPPGDLSNPGIYPVSLTSPALVGEFFTTSATWEALHRLVAKIKYSVDGMQ